MPHAAPLEPMPQVEWIPHDALIVVDVQNDFFEKGTLPVPGAEAIVPLINRCIHGFAERGFHVFATRCWHPLTHCSFVGHGGPWPQHCVAGTRGAEFYPTLKLPLGVAVISKGALADRDAYSGFQGTELSSLLREQLVRRLFVCGLATDYCVLNTVTDALEKGLATFVITDAVAAVNREPGDGERALHTMRERGAVLLNLKQIAGA